MDQYIGNLTNSRRGRIACLASTLVVTTLLLAGCASVKPVRLPPEQSASIRAAAAKVVPHEAKIDVSAVKKRSLDHPTIIISGHLLEGKSTEDSNPYVQGDYGTHEKLTRLARHRAFRIMRSVLQEAQVGNVSELVVSVRHGVRVSTVTVYQGIQMPATASDLTKMISSVRISLADTPPHGWLSISQGQFMHRWTVEANIIPSLEFRSSRFPHSW
jgi:hypothetical protein